jgi:hypothetical protein
MSRDASGGPHQRFKRNPAMGYHKSPRGIR